MPKKTKSPYTRNRATRGDDGPVVPVGPYHADGALLPAGAELMKACVAAYEGSELVAERMGLTVADFENRIHGKEGAWCNAWRIATAKQLAVLMRAQGRHALVADSPSVQQFILRTSGVSEKAALEKNNAGPAAAPAAMLNTLPPDQYAAAKRMGLIVEHGPNAATFVGAEANRDGIDNPAGTFVVPGSRSREEYMAAVGQTHPHDTRDTKKIIEALQRQGKSNAQIAAYLFEHGHDRAARELLNDPKAVGSTRPIRPGQFEAWRKLAMLGDEWACTKIRERTGYVHDFAIPLPTDLDELQAYAASGDGPACEAISTRTGYVNQYTELARNDQPFKKGN